MGRKTNYEKVREQDRRDKISITKHLNQLTDIQAKLENNGEDLGKDSGPYISSLRLRADISLALLKKRLPDLKAVELSGPDGGNIPTSIRIDYSSPVPGKAEDTEPEGEV